MPPHFFSKKAYIFVSIFEASGRCFELIMKMKERSWSRMIIRSLEERKWVENVIKKEEKWKWRSSKDKEGVERWEVDEDEEVF